MKLWADLGDAFFAWLKFPKIGVSLRFQWTGFTAPKEKNMPPEYRYFKPEEVVGLDPEYVSKLDMATAKTAELDPNGKRTPFFITSGFRSIDKNESIIGSVPNSAHTKGLATDLRVENDHEAYLIIASLISVGITRFGIYINSAGAITHIHNDVDPDKVPEVIWIKGEGKPNSDPATV